MTTLQPSPDPAPQRLVVRTPCPGVRTLHVAGPLDRDAAARLLRLADVLLALVRSGDRPFRHLVVDLADVRFEVGGTAALRHVGYSCRLQGVQAHVAGVSHPDVPVRARQHLSGFGTYPTAEAAERALDPPGEGR